MTKVNSFLGVSSLIIEPPKVVIYSFTKCIYKPLPLFFHVPFKGVPHEINVLSLFATAFLAFLVAGVCLFRPPRLLLLELIKA